MQLKSDSRSTDLILCKGELRHRLSQKPHALAEFIKSQVDELGLPAVPINLLQGWCHFFIKKGLVSAKTLETDIETLIDGVQRLNTLMAGQDFYKSQAFRYYTEETNLEVIIEQVFLNARFWTSRFGADFFERYHPHSKERKTVLRADLDETFYLSCKGGSGLGTFSVDFALGMKGRDYALNVPAGEIWRTGVDTACEDDQQVLRVIRSGSGVKGSEIKREGYKTFVDRYKTTPQRLLAFLVMYFGKELEMDEIRALSAEGIRTKNATLLGHKQISFDYSRFFESVGFKPSSNTKWMTMGNPRENFYSTLLTQPEDQRGLRGNEVRALDAIIRAFNRLHDITGTAVKCPVVLCSEQTREEVLAALVVFRQIQGK